MPQFWLQIRNVQLLKFLRPQISTIGRVNKGVSVIYIGMTSFETQ
jgi:hypothetical protein